MIYLLALAGWIFAAWRWGDWRNWQRYHTSIFYICFCDILYYFLTSDYPLWRLEPSGVISSVTGAVVIELLIFICSVLIYLGRFPKKLMNAILWIGFWALLYTLLEWGLLRNGVFTYHHGWTLFKSALFDLVAFPILRLHFTRPLLTYILSIPIIILLIHLNHVPIH